MKEVLEAGNAIIVFPDLAHVYGPFQTNEWAHTYAIFNGPQFELLKKTGVLDSDKPIWQLDSIGYWNQRIEEMPEFRISEVPNSKSKVSGAIHTTPDRNEDSRFRGQDRRAASRIDMATKLLSGPVDGVWIAPEK